jgi:hypothetical protein
VVEQVTLVLLMLNEPLDFLFEVIQAGLNIVWDLEMVGYPFGPDVHFWIIIRVLIFTGHKYLDLEVTAEERKDILMEFAPRYITQRGGNKLKVQPQKRTDVSWGFESTC